MYTKITKIEEQNHKGQLFKIIFFEYNGVTKFNYASEKVIQYWKKKLDDPTFEFKVGMEINVFQSNYKNGYRIVGVK